MRAKERNKGRMRQLRVRQRGLMPVLGLHPLPLRFELMDATRQPVEVVNVVVEGLMVEDLISLMFERLKGLRDT